MTETSTASQRFQARFEAIERAKAEIARRERVTLLALLPLSAALALIIPYMQIVLTLQEADYYYILERPAWPTYLRLASSALFAGPVSMGLVLLVYRQLDDFLPTFGRMVVVGAAFGVIMPFFTGLFTPLNLFVIGVTGVSNVSGQGSVAQMIGDWVFSTPMFTFLFWIKWLGPGIVFGLITGLLLWTIVKVVGPVERKENAMRLYIASVFVSGVVLVLVTVWPYALFSFMFETSR